MSEKPLEPEVVPPKGDAIALPQQMANFESQILRTLTEADKRRGEPGEFISLAETWKELREYDDPNAMILDNLKELQLLIKDHMARIVRDTSIHDEHLMKILDEPGVDDQKWATAHEKYDKQRRENLKVSKDLANTSVRLASEHRQCLQQSKFMFHLRDVLQVRLIMLAVLNRMIHDRRLLNEIGTELDTAFGKLYPVSVRSDTPAKE